MTEVFEQELREQLALARRALREARDAEDDHGAQAHAGRIAGLLRIAEQHGIAVPSRSGTEPEPQKES
ncbi:MULTISPECIES: hypothetical protein [Kitasatospora]|uniref:hypothetical protein n=1 Tax=Kitasatospora TaxID=2063 RepID=UPI000C280562|nr:hypothetical protein [Kitasatospora sp. CB02891]PJN25448.1 hypothetical protein CG736_13635 [Kitasatospora sp. CB02891]